MARRYGIVLAGGRGERLGMGRPKAGVELAGSTLLERAVRVLAAACDDVLVVAPSGLDLGPVTARRVADAAGHAGPVAGLVAGLEAAGDARCALLGVDFPCVTSALVRVLLERLEDQPALDVVAPRPRGVPQPLVSAVAAPAAPRIRAALESGETSLRGVFGVLAVAWLDDPDIDRLPGGAEALLNVNTPADLNAARARLEAGAGRKP